MDNTAHIAQYYAPDANDKVRCLLCPHACRIAEGASGLCRVRTNHRGVLYADTYGHPAALAVDPIEKKPLNWFMPGTKAFSIGTFGCNLGCQFCQNDELSRSPSDRAREYPFMTPQNIIALALEHHCQSVALTYNEPTIFLEYAVDICHAAREAGLATVLVSNGYINPEPRAELYKLIDAANIDLKGWGDFYHNLCAAALKPVLDSCIYFKQVCHGHLELTNLLIPEANTSHETLTAMLEWVAQALGRDTPLHFSAYHPAGGYSAPPTPRETVLAARDLARAMEFEHVAVGNIR